MNREVLGRLVLVVCAELIVYAVVFWMMSERHAPVEARLWHTTMRAARWVAHRAGRLGIEAEHRYYLAVGR